MRQLKNGIKTQFYIMKNVLKFSIVLCFIISFVSCKQNEPLNNSLDLSHMELDLKIDFSKGKFKISEGMPNLAKELSDYIYSNDLKASERINQFNLRKSGNEILINYPLDTTTVKTFRMPLAPCAPKTVTCRSESCVIETLIKILGDGSRDVNIEYRRNYASVTITYTYLERC